MSERFLDKIFQAFEDVAVQQEQSAPIVPADGDDMTWNETDEPLTYAALVRTVYRLQNEMAGLAAQVVELRERLKREQGEL
jgi:hypothetical protein